MKKIILVGGYCASGKSTFSQKLSEMLKIPVFNKDNIKEVMGNGYGRDHDIVERKGSAVTLMLMLHIADRLLKAGKACILESNFKSRDIEQLRALLEKYGCKCITFNFKGDFDILFSRYMKRDVMEKRHWVHNASEETIETFRKDHLEQGIGDTGIGEIITRDATDFSRVDYDELFAIAGRFIEEG